MGREEKKKEKKVHPDPPTSLRARARAFRHLDGQIAA